MQRYIFPVSFFAFDNYQKAFRQLSKELTTIVARQITRQMQTATLGS